MKSRKQSKFINTGRLRGKKQAALDIINKCKVCSQFKKSPPRPRVGLPAANDFNEIVGLDLKVVDQKRGHYILWMVDLFSKFIKGVFLKDKTPASIIEGIVSRWVIGDGGGPGHPRKGFWSDNGGEFLNQELIDYAARQNIQIKMTAANAPWQNGCVERNHATADIIYQKLMDEDPNMSNQDAIDKAAFAKNSEVNSTKFTALQLMMGQNPSFPGIAEVNPTTTNLDSKSKYMKSLKKIDKARVMFREIECNEKLKKVMSQRINPNVEKSYKIGERVFFYDDRKKEWKPGTALVKLGKTLYLRYGNFLRRVAIDKVRPDLEGEEKKEEEFLEPEDDEARFKEEESPIQEMAAKLELSEKVYELKVENDALKDEIKKLKVITDNKISKPS